MLALDTAMLMADEEAGSVTVLTVDSGRAPFDAEAFVNRQLAEGKRRVPVHTVNVKGRGIVDTIMEVAADYDLIVAGCTRRPVIHQITHGTIPEELARRCEKPMIMVHASAGLSSWLRRWF